MKFLPGNIKSFRFKLITEPRTYVHGSSFGNAFPKPFQILRKTGKPKPVTYVTGFITGLSVPHPYITMNYLTI